MAFTAWINLALVATGSGLWWGWRRPGARPAERGACVLLPPLLVALLFVYTETAWLNTRWVWSACRLAPTIGLLHGYPLYSSADSGAINGWLYGPVAALAWLPAAFASSPQPALLIAAIINLVFLLAPLLLLARRVVPDSQALAGLLFAAAAAALLQLYPTWYMASALNADAIAVGLGLSSCLLLLDHEPTRTRTTAAAALAALAAWTKQVEAPLLLAQAGWLWFARGRRPALDFVIAWAATMAVVAAALWVLSDTRSLILNLWTVPSQHPLAGGWAAARHEVADLLRYAFPLWMPAIIVVAAGWRRSGPPGPTGLLLIAALALLPTGIIATIKVGGDRNSLHSVYYLIAAAMPAAGGAWLLRRPRGRDLQAGILAALAVTLLGFAVRQVRDYPGLPLLPPRCLSEEAFAFAREHPGRAYFPWDPLATLLADGKMYPFEYGVYDRQLAGLRPDIARVRSSIPQQIDFVIYPRANYPRTMVKEYLTDFRLTATTGDWIIHRRAAAPEPGPGTAP